jgi:hypothetical protein
MNVHAKACFKPPEKEVATEKLSHYIEQIHINK